MKKDTALQLLFVLLASAQILYSMWWTSPTADEGRHFWWSQRLVEQGVVSRDINSVTPAPTLNVLTSYLKDYVPLSIVPENFNGQRAWFFKRLGSLAWFLGLVFGVRSFIRFTGLPHADTLAVAMVCTDPSLLGHSALVTVDVPFAAAVVWFLYASWRYILSPSVFIGACLGLALALLFTAKFTAVLFLPVFFLAILLPVLRKLIKGSEVQWWRLGLAPCFSLISVIMVVNLSYRLIDIRFFISEYELVSPILKEIRGLLPNLAVPLPQSFVAGVDTCLLHERSPMWNVIFNDKWYSEGHPLYFPIMFVYKNNILYLAIIIGSVLLLLRERMLSVQKYLLLVIAFSWLYFCFVFKTQVGLRYVFFTLPLIAMLSATAIARSYGKRLVYGLALMLTLISLFSLYPHQGALLTYFNRAFVSSKKPYLYLVDSNFDWEGSRFLWEQARNENRSLGRLPLNPGFPQPGENLYTANFLAGVLWDFPRNIWLRRNIEPVERIAQTYFRFNFDPATFEHYVKHARNFSPVPDINDFCRNGHDIMPLEDGEALGIEITNSEVACVEVKKGGVYLMKGQTTQQDIGLVASMGWCESMDTSGATYVPFSLQPGKYIFCSNRGYKGDLLSNAGFSSP